MVMLLGAWEISWTSIISTLSISKVPFKWRCLSRGSFRPRKMLEKFGMEYSSEVSDIRACCTTKEDLNFFYLQDEKRVLHKITIFWKHKGILDSSRRAKKCSTHSHFWGWLKPDFYLVEKIKDLKKS